MNLKNFVLVATLSVAAPYALSAPLSDQQSPNSTTPGSSTHTTPPQSAPGSNQPSTTGKTGNGPTGDGPVTATKEDL